MHALVVKIRLKDWWMIGFLALFFSASLSVFSYSLIKASLLDGFLFGVLLGVLLFAGAFFFTTLLNRYVLPKTPSSWWLLLASASSFLSGYIASGLSLLFSSVLHVSLLEPLRLNPQLFSLFVGTLSCVVALLLYQFIALSHAKALHEKRLIESRLKSLERQLNPHFLFNALNSVMELLHVNPDKAENALLRLCDFLRFSMRERSLISIFDELENVKRYVTLENIRFGGKILLDEAIPSSLLTHQLPKFSIQLLVENAIKHGFTGEALRIEIEALGTNKSIELRVKNNGKAMQESTFGIGLSNLQERLALLCQGSLCLEETQTPTFKITLKEPL